MNNLEKYKKKRRFDSTPEPTGLDGQKSNQKHTFVVQKHKARHLHFDFRLESEGVLKSWSVPKGLPTTLTEKRLAIMVEDHPLEYKDFEGKIPEGNYGAGIVMIWDFGTYEVKKQDHEKYIKEGINKGHLKIILHGKKLRGKFALVRIKEEKNEWLVIKEKDEFNLGNEQNDRSAISGKKMDEIEKNEETRIWLSDINLGKAPCSSMPKNIKPMLAKFIDKPFDKTGWIFEIKWDGYRAIAEIQKNSSKLYSRNNLPLEIKFPQVFDELSKIKVDAVIDGEIVVLDQTGKPNFQLIQDWDKDHEGWLQYMAFDIIYLQGHDLTNFSLLDRKKILQKVLTLYDLNFIKFTDHIEERGERFFQEAIKQGLEGIIAKKKDSPYLFGVRSSNWLKIRNIKTQDCIIVGYSEPQGGRKYFGALILAVYSRGELVYTGNVGTGFTDDFAKYLYKKMGELSVEEPVLKISLKKVHWVKPELVCEVKYTEITNEGYMRHPIFLRLRDDKLLNKQ